MIGLTYKLTKYIRLEIPAFRGNFTLPLKVT